MFYWNENDELGGSGTGSDRIFNFADVSAGVGGHQSFQSQTGSTAGVVVVVGHRFDSGQRYFGAVLATPLDVRRRIAGDAAFQRDLASE